MNNSNKIISVYGSSGREANQSLLSLNLAIAFSSQNEGKTAFLDLSFSGDNNLETLLNIKTDKTALSLKPVILSLDAKFITGYLPEHPCGIVVLEGLAADKKALITPGEFAAIIEVISSAYALTVVSAPEGFDAHLEAVLSASDLVLLSVEPHILSLKRAGEFLNAAKSWHFPLNLFKPVVNSADLKNALDGKKIEDYLGLKPFFEISGDNEAILSSINSGNPCVLSSPYSPFSTGVKNLARQLMDEKLYSITGKPQKHSAVTVEKAQPSSAARDGLYLALKEKIHKKLIEKLDLKNIGRETARTAIEELLSREDTGLSREERSAFVEDLLDDALGLGCLEKLLKDPDVTEIMVNGHDKIYVEKKGKLTLTGMKFNSASQLRTIIDRIVSPIGRRVDESSPLVDARLADGSRVNAIIPPLSLVGPVVTIRKFSKKKLLVEDLIGFGALNKEMADFLRVCVRLRKNIIVSGGTGSGKTTLLNVVSSFIPGDERIVTIEDSAELKLPQDHVVSLESRPPSLEGTGAVPIRSLVINALRMRPDRIVVGECRGGETLDMLQAMNTGHDGSLTTIHANTPKDGIARISTMVIMAGTELPEKAIREQISSAVHLIVQLSRLSDGSRKVVEIAELRGIKNDAVDIVSLFKYSQSGLVEGKVEGKFVATGNIPSFFEEIKIHGLELDINIFKA